MGQRPDPEKIIELARAYGDKNVWSKIPPGRASREPDGSLRARNLFTYALVLCEANQDLDRLETLFEWAREMQDQDPQSPTYGNFRWKWEDRNVEDLNAVDFCMRGAALLLRHKERMPQDARDILLQIVNGGVQACQDHKVPERYTNIILMNATNLVLLGKALNRPEVTQKGYQRLDRFCIYTYEWGVHEYCSPTYTGLDLSCLGLVERFCGDPRAQAQARALLRLFWTDVALNRLSSSHRPGGAFSRKLGDYLERGGDDDYLGEAMRVAGWLSQQASEHMRVIYPALVRLQPPDDLLRQSDRFPRLVRQSWGPIRRDARTSRTHYVCKDVTLSTASAGYDYPANEDLPLTVDFPTSSRCCFIPDTHHDPYGKNAKHHSPLLWAAAQRQGDALGLVLYRPDYRDTLESHFVMPWPADGLWVGSRPVDMQKMGAAILDPDDALVLREGTAAVGVRVVWTRTLKNRRAPVMFHHEKEAVRSNAVRMTVQHHFLWNDSDTRRSWTNAGAAFWVRIGSGLKTEDAFRRWREAFVAAEVKVDPDEGEGALKRLRVEVKGTEGPLMLETVSPEVEHHFVTRIEPPPSHAVLELDGKGIGRPILKDTEPIRSYEAELTATLPVKVPGYWEAEGGRVLPPMRIGEDKEASGGRYVWMPESLGERGSDVGNVTWLLNVPEAGIYYVWGRVQAPTPQDDSFIVRILQEMENPLYLAIWFTGVRTRWEWTPVDLRETGKSKAPTKLNLPEGEVKFQLFAREAGAKIDRLFITSDPGERPA